jgi:hypothetical protein
MKQSSIEWLMEIDKSRAITIEEWQQAKEMEKMHYTEFEVLQLLLKLQQTESYDNLCDWFQENKKTNL